MNDFDRAIYEREIRRLAEDLYVTERLALVAFLALVTSAAISGDTYWYGVAMGCGFIGWPLSKMLRRWYRWRAPSPSPYL